MRQAKLIKREEQAQQKKAENKPANVDQAAFTRSVVKTAQGWVKDFQTNERSNARQQFAALFA